MFIAVDIGTTNVKAVAFDSDDALIFSTEIANQTYAPQEGWSEQVPEMVFENVCTAIRATRAFLNQNRPSIPLQGIVFSAAMHGLVALDAQGQPMGNFMLWSDVRAQTEARELLLNGVGQRFYQKTGVPIHPMSPLLKLIWLRKNAPAICQKAHKFLGIKGYVWYRLTGQFESDISCASATGLMNLLEMRWDEEALSLAEISSKQLPALVSPYKKTFMLGNTAGKLMDLPLENVPLIIGASDGALANLGSGATQPGQLALTIGTSAAVRMMTTKPLLDAQMRTFCYRLDETRFIVGGASNNGGNALEWLREYGFSITAQRRRFCEPGDCCAVWSRGLAIFTLFVW
jgi:gluconokinase